jgi:hypothetical protein
LTWTCSPVARPRKTTEPSWAQRVAPSQRKFCGHFLMPAITRKPDIHGDHPAARRAWQAYPFLCAYHHRTGADPI